MGTTDTSASFTGVGGHTYYFRARARDNAFNLQPWPANYQVSVTVESAAPNTHVDLLESLTRGNQVTLNWEGFDTGGSGIAGYDIQYMDESVGVWQDWLTGTIDTSAVFTGEPGHTHYFRSRGTDNALNVEAWPAGEGDATTTFYNWLTSGTARDNTGVPVSGMQLTINPQAFLTNSSDIDGNYSAYLAENPEVKTITWFKDLYGALPPTDFGLADANIDVYLPPADNIVQDSGFESGIFPGAWQVGGEIPPTITDTLSHSGDFAASLGTASPLAPRAYLRQAQSDAITTDPLGNLHMAWVIYENGSLKFSYNKRSPDGTWSLVEMVTELNYLYIYDIKIAVDGFHNVHLLITPANGWGFWDVVYVVRDANGIWSDPQVVFTGSRVYDMVSDGDSKLHALLDYQGSLSYAHYELGGIWEIEPVPGRFHNNDASFDKAKQGIYFGVASSFAVGKQGEIHVVLTAPGEVSYILRRPDGTWTDARILVRSEKEPENAGVLLDSLGRPHIIWDEWWSGGGLLYASVNPDGSWSIPIRLGNDWGEQLLLIDKNDVLYAISHDADSGEILFWQKRIFGIWSAPLKISNSNGTAQHPAAEVSENGDLYVVWRDYYGGCCYGVKYSTRHAGIWSIPVDLTDPLSVTELTRISVDALGCVHILWLENESLTDLYYVGTIPLSQSGDSWLSQSLTVPISITNPTLSFLANLSGVSAISGNEFQVQVSSGITTTTLFTSTTPTPWEHFWFDLTPWSGQLITLTFQLTENAGFPPANALLDEVTLGSAHPDLWVDLSSDVLSAIPGEQFNFQLEYGNRGQVSALTPIITLTLPSGLNFVSASVTPEIIADQLVWHLDDLPKQSAPNSITLTVEVDSAVVLGQKVVTVVEIASSSPELERLNNNSQVGTFLGYLGILPLINR